METKDTTPAHDSLPWLEDLYRSTLLEDIVPWWIRYAIDPNGGINTCIRDDGTLVSRDRWNWSQWRAVWVFSKLYNAIGPRRQWLDAARGIYDFVTSHGPLDDGHWPLLLDGEGAVLRGYESIYVDGFAIYGLTEFYRATGDEAALELALATFRAVQCALNAPAPPPACPYPITPGRRPHALSMLFSLAFHELAEVSGREQIREAALEHHCRVLNGFLSRKRDLVLEWLDERGDELPPPEGTVVVPGHAVESMWFQMHIAGARGDIAAIDQAVSAIHRHLEIGWDPELGGILLAVDADGRAEAAWPHAQAKLWWPHTEALYATLLAYEHCRESWCLDWHEKVRRYSFVRYPVADHGEWRQKLDRLGRPITETLVLPVKDPFHLPRALIYCVEVLERLNGNGSRIC